MTAERHALYLLPLSTRFLARERARLGECTPPTDKARTQDEGYIDSTAPAPASHSPTLSAGSASSAGSESPPQYQVSVELPSANASTRIAPRHDPSKLHMISWKLTAHHAKSVGAGQGSYLLAATAPELSRPNSSKVVVHEGSETSSSIILGRAVGVGLAGNETAAGGLPMFSPALSTSSEDPLSIHNVTPSRPPMESLIMAQTVSKRVPLAPYRSTSTFPNSSLNSRADTAGCARSRSLTSSSADSGSESSSGSSFIASLSAGPPAPSPSVIFDPFEIHRGNSDLLPLDRLGQFLDDTLREMGVFRQARRDFVGYWLPRFKDTPYIAVRFLQRELYESLVPVRLSSTHPVSLHRVLALFRRVRPDEVRTWEDPLRSASAPPVSQSRTRVSRSSREKRKQEQHLQAPSGAVTPSLLQPQAQSQSSAYALPDVTVSITSAGMQLVRHAPLAHEKAEQAGVKTHDWPRIAGLDDWRLDEGLTLVEIGGMDVGSRSFYFS